ncbi:uncharacterized protein PSFLO_06963 [Pseudozyma flocculosa]|uniref:Uncharacterized protein n=1 Tax=Pseudozyma flocculosa TaxID=84751 RepID=A0A5C3FDE4_9BASI|nr:uncharacterized protein PSFLO_06963 [Pseudozyma flocculosa]
MAWPGADSVALRWTCLPSCRACLNLARLQPCSPKLAVGLQENNCRLHAGRLQAGGQATPASQRPPDVCTYCSRLAPPGATNTNNTAAIPCHRAPTSAVAVAVGLALALALALAATATVRSSCLRTPCMQRTADAHTR